MSEKTGLYTKMAQIMGELQRIGKHGKSDQLKYDFVKDADVADVIRAQLAKHNIAFFVSVLEATQDGITSKHGTAGYHTIVHLEYTFVCGDTGETNTSKWIGESDAYDDKGISKAVTLAQKYFLLKTFVLSTGDPADDPDSASEEATTRKARQSSPKRPQPKHEDDHWADTATVGKMLDWAVDEFWQGDIDRVHGINRVASALGVTPERGSDFAALVVAIRLGYKGSKADAMRAIQTYEPQSDGKRKANTQAALPGTPNPTAGKDAAERSGIAG